LQVGDFKEKDGFVDRWICLLAFSIQANKTRIAVELDVMSGLIAGYPKAESLCVELLGPLEVIEIKLSSHESR
jgi:hypothetical protein